MKNNILMHLFFIAWLVCGCSADTMLDDPRAGVVALVSMIVAVCCAIGISREDSKSPTGSCHSHRGR